MTSKLTREENVQAVFDLKAGYTLGLADVEILKRVARMALVAMDSEPDRNPVLAYADSYRDMAKQGIESVPIWSVITDLERNIAPLYRHAQQSVVPDAIPVSRDIDAGYLSGWNDCRAAMLQAVPLTNEGDIQAGNSPVILDGSASMLRRWLAFGRGMQNAGSQLPHNLIAETESMLAAAPQSPSSEPATVPGKWSPVSEQMPEDRTQVILWDAEIGEVTSGHYSHKTHTFYHCGDAIENEITHWMPPPCAPQEVNRE